VAEQDDSNRQALIESQADALTQAGAAVAVLAINLRTAQALGLTVPPHVLLQATEVLQ
jgi:hypothetical protein